jgi:hypothetical protein
MCSPACEGMPAVLPAGCGVIWPLRVASGGNLPQDSLKTQYVAALEPDVPCHPSAARPRRCNVRRVRPAAWPRVGFTDGKPKGPEVTRSQKDIEKHHEDHNQVLPRSVRRTPTSC